jgi:hypothetical protein
MKGLKHATDPPDTRSAFRRVGLIVNPQISPSMMLVDRTKLNGMIDASDLPEIPEVDKGTEPSGNGSRGQAIRFFGFVNVDCFPDE